MFLELIATIAAGIGAAGLVLAINIMAKGRLPKWMMPIGAGAAMIGVTVANEYSWGARTAEGLPEGIVVVSQEEERNWYRPWSYMIPLTARLVALDTASIQTNPAAPDVRLADLYLFQRWHPPARVPQLIDCAAAARADVSDAALANTEAARWLSADQSLIAEACRERASG